MDNTYEKALAEVYEILICLPEEMRLKIPEKLIELIKKEKDKEHKVNIKHPLNTRDYSKEAIVLLGMIYEDYLCTPEEKNTRKKRALELKQIYDQEISEKYNVDKLFKDKKESPKENLALVQVKQNWFAKIKEFFKRII